MKEQFEAAADAVVAGDVEALRTLLLADHGLVQVRSERPHRATLLHYCAANGVEEERQHTPANIVEIAELLLEHGADAEARAELYGGITAFELIATSVHPERAGVQNALLELLLVHGVPPCRVTLCLDHNRWGAAKFLADRGGEVNFAAAAGLGDVKQMRHELDAGFLYACRFGQNAAVEFLLNYGVDVEVVGAHGQTGLHWAVMGGHLDTVTLLLKHGAPLEVRNQYGGTVLGQARWSGADAAIIDALIAAGAVRS